MGLENHIEMRMRGILNNPILSLMHEIKLGTILKQSHFKKRSTGAGVYGVLLHLVYMLLMNKRQSAFIKQSAHAYGKDTYYRFLGSTRYNWRKLLLLSTQALLKKIQPLQKHADPSLLILDDTVEIKRGKKIEAGSKSLWSNKEGRKVKGINIVSLNWTDTYTTFQVDFALATNRTRLIAHENFAKKLHHRSNAYARRVETTLGKNQLAMQMLKRALEAGIDAEYLLIDSWYAKPSFIQEARAEGIDVIARIANNNTLWRFEGKAHTLDRLYATLAPIKVAKRGTYGEIRFTYFGTTVHHATLGRVKLVFLHTGNTLVVLLSTDCSLDAKAIIDLYKKRWNIEQGYKDLRAYFGLGKEEHRHYEALIARITLSMFAYNLVAYLNRIQHEPQTLGELFRELECELEALVISMQLFLQILTQTAQIMEKVKGGNEIRMLIAVLGAYVEKEVVGMCES